MRPRTRSARRVARTPARQSATTNCAAADTSRRVRSDPAGRRVNNARRRLDISAQRDSLDPMTTVYLNGEFVPHERALISVDDRGFVFGDGIYEGLRAIDGKVFEWHAHADR